MLSTQRRKWMVSCPLATSSSSDPCTMLRERCAGELEIDESYSTHENGRRYMLFHVDRKVRACVVERALQQCGVLGCEVIGHQTEWYALIQRHLEARDPRAVAWMKPGKARTMLTGRPAAPATAAEVVSRVATRLQRDDVGTMAVDRDAQFESALAIRDAEHARAMAAKDEEMRSVLQRREEAVLRAADAEDRLATVMAGLRGSGDAGQREVALSVDLIAEQRRGAVLAARLKVAEDQLAAERESRVEAVARHVAKYRALEGEMASLRAEAVRWECGLEARQSALEVVCRDRSDAMAQLQRLGAENSAKDALITVLRKDAMALARAELEAGIAKREDSARAEIESMRRDTRFKSRRWKRVNETLRDRLAVLEAQVDGHRGE